MMEWFRQLARALRNLARIARANPVWAIGALALSPFKLLRHLFSVVILSSRGNGRSSPSWPISPIASSRAGSIRRDRLYRF
ncbi:hypothetical protein [Rhizorhapis sp. SPR117]|uniref:hypothetical protein n=1 Tax=Rhizorhapis sp. SPR117 TaxID=2912611 RepID=UPI001F491B04|nr:hypothetical protein [Rhizorhapis sp. SPR117]